jgi:major vault protein
MSVDQLTMGKLFIIKGTEVSFYIPPTGIEVIPDENGEYTREAVTLERLEYCMLLDENGSKRYVRGPAVVFPEPTETFVSQDGAGVKRRAIELTDEMGVYVKVTADYSEGEHERKMGDELFITGKDQKIYYPREEHALIKYGTQERHFGVAIPEGEARYLMNKQTGSVKLVKGPTLLLPDPRREVLIRRVPPKTTR